MTERIGGAADPRIADYRNVPDRELLRRRGLFVAEGRLVVVRLLASARFRTRSVMLTEAAHTALATDLRLRPDLPVYIVPQPLMNEVAGFDIHRGCLAIGERPPLAPWQGVASGARVLLMLEGIANADNIGGIFRNASALGAGAVLLDSVSTDPLYRKAIRTSMGAALHVPFARMAPWPDAFDELRRSGVTIAGMTPSPAATPLPDVVRTLQGRRVAILLGHEGEGLTPGAAARCDVLARIPMRDDVDSLNVATAAGIALYEFQRG